jgi:hypothetical protein
MSRLRLPPHDGLRGCGARNGTTWAEQCAAGRDAAAWGAAARTINCRNCSLRTADSSEVGCGLNPHLLRVITY